MSRFAACLVFTLLGSGAALCQAQGLPAHSPGPGTLYRLDAAASYQETCFAPCPCPPGDEAISIRGTFVLGPARPGNVVDFRRVSQIHWTANAGDTLIHVISGDGVYKVTNFSPDRDHSLELRLSIDGAPPRYFFSDFVPVDADGPAIDIQVSMNGLFCYDTVIRVSAAPVPPEELLPYRLVGGSSYQQGCFDPCDCILEKPRPLVGGFALVPLLVAGTYAEYAVVGLRFGVPGPDGDLAIRLTGVGRYTLIQGFAGPIHAMALLLRLNGNGPLRFDQELENATTFFPDIDISVDLNDMVCFDRILDLHARPASPDPAQPGRVRQIF